MFLVHHNCAIVDWFFKGVEATCSCSLEGERLCHIQKVSGSNPLGSTTNLITSINYGINVGKVYRKSGCPVQRLMDKPQKRGTHPWGPGRAPEYVKPKSVKCSCSLVGEYLLDVEKIVVRFHTGTQCLPKSNNRGSNPRPSVKGNPSKQTGADGLKVRGMPGRHYRWCV